MQIEYIFKPVYRIKSHWFPDLKDKEGENPLFDWEKQARNHQKIPRGNWRIWLILAGRGFGKTRTGAETIRAWVHQRRYRRIALIGETIGETRDVMIEGESGLLAIHPFQENPKFEPSKRRLTWPNGAIATLFGGDHFEQLRGPQFDAAWIDELAKFRYPNQTWEQLMLGLRLGKDPRCIITTTPRPIPLLHSLLARSDVTTTRGTTFENQANLPAAFLEQILYQFKGTRLEAQEIYAEMLTHQDGALWHREMIEYRQPPCHTNGDYLLKRIVIAIDPATTHTQASDETGIIVAGLAEDGYAYVLDDLSGRFSPADWSQRVITAYRHWKADRIVAEINKGGDLVEQVLRTSPTPVSYKAVRATRGKITRAEPISALYEQKRIFHLRPFKELETQLCSYTSRSTSTSPDRLDALVWALTELMLGNPKHQILNIWNFKSL